MVCRVGGSSALELSVLAQGERQHRPFDVDEPLADSGLHRRVLVPVELVELVHELARRAGDQQLTADGLRRVVVVVRVLADLVEPRDDSFHADDVRGSGPQAVPDGVVVLLPPSADAWLLVDGGQDAQPPLLEGAPDDHVVSLAGQHVHDAGVELETHGFFLHELCAHLATADRPL